MTERPCTLAQCPIGLFWWGRTLCLKTEYGNNEGRIDAYIVKTGEFFWGAQPQTIAHQRQQIVIPLPSEHVIVALDEAEQRSKFNAELTAEGRRELAALPEAERSIVNWLLSLDQTFPFKGEDIAGLILSGVHRG